MSKRPFRHIWTALGLLALALGAIGAVMPVLPTTPFVILAAFLFSKGSPRLHAYLANHPQFGPAIRDWQATGSIHPRYKAIAVGMMAVTFLVSVLLALPWHVLAIQAVCMGGAAVFVLTRPSGR